MIITPQVAKELAEIIRQHHAAVAAVLFGRGAVTKEAYEYAKKIGLIGESETFESVFGDLVTFGAFLAHVEHAEAASMTLDQFRGHVAKHPVPRTQVEVHAAEFNARHGAEYVTGLGSKAAEAAVQTAIKDASAGEDKIRQIMRDMTSANYGDHEAQARLRDLKITTESGENMLDDVFRDTVRETTRNLGHATGLWERDLQRIAQTEGQFALNEGIKERWEAQEGELAERRGRAPRQILAYKLPRPSACKHCNHLHLEGGAPRLYWMREIVANGTNVGVKKANWRVTVGPAHPWCHPGDVEITTGRGRVPISEVEAGDIVLTHRGRWRPVSRTFARDHIGPLYEVNGVPATPEHPFLTRRGWVPAHQIRQSDHVFEVVEPLMADPDHVPAMRQKVGVLAHVLGAFASRVMPSPTVYFDGDLADHDVDQVSAYKNSRSCWHRLSECLEHLDLQRGLELPFLPHVSLPNMLLGLTPATAGVMSSLDLSPALFGGLPRSNQACSFCGRTGLDAQPDQTSFDRGPRHPKAPRNLQDRETLPDVEIFEQLRINPNFLPHLRPHSVVARRIAGGCRVYNLMVMEDDSFVANGTVVHNCGCTLHRVPWPVVGRVEAIRGWRSGMSAPSVIGPGGDLSGL